jgi:outer membrane protein OmpA-like peptidoglycan-associated protein
MKKIYLFFSLVWVVIFSLNAQETESGFKIPDFTDIYQIKNLSINSYNSDFGVAYYNDETIVFSSTRKDSENVSKRWEGNNQFFLNFYVGDSLVDGDVMRYESLMGEGNSKFHESNAAFNRERTKVYFTRNNFYESKKSLSSDRKMKLAIYIADVGADGRWYNIVPFPYNSEEYNNGHPTLSLDGKTMYFTSDMSGTLGRTDIFKVDITSTGTFTVPQNLGGNVNTAGREMFPFIAPDGTLYFSSDGHSGMGKLDIFKTDSDELELASVQNIGQPFNSTRDDFAYVLNDNMIEGYFSSNRPGGKGDDDIYYFTSEKKREVVVKKVEIQKPIVCKNTIIGTITDEHDQSLLMGALVEIIDIEGNTVFKSTIGDTGAFLFEAKCDQSYLIKASKPFYLSEEFKVSTTNEFDDEIVVNISLIPEVIKRGDKFLVDVNSIYFDYNDYSINKQAAMELDKVIAFMYKYPRVIIEGGSHTDSRGPESYNLTLSTKRAEATVNYIMKSGNFDSSRISARGYGETSPVNECVDGVKCSEEEHSKNRRTEFLIVNPESIQ